jgi:hypothetical protein
MNENKNNINIGDDPTLSLSSIPETILEEEYNEESERNISPNN